MRDSIYLWTVDANMKRDSFVGVRGYIIVSRSGNGTAAARAARAAVIIEARTAHRVRRVSVVGPVALGRPISRAA